MIYFTSDLHLFHDKSFIYEPRGYSNAIEMSIDLITKINNKVKEDDTLYILGDLILDDLDLGTSLLNCINCKQVYIILGNHDTNNKQEELFNSFGNLYGMSYGMPLKYKKFRFFLSHYPVITSNNDAGKKINQRVYNLCGHTHTKNKFELMEKGISSYHVEVDAHNNEPVSIEEIIKDIEEFYNKAL